VIYFDYDKAEIKSEYVAVIGAHAKFLNGNVNRKIRLEGHTDERGSREYNIGLGERRAQQVRRALMLQGVTEAQVMTVSYGEERPAASGSDEEAYSKNRRVEMSYFK
jgi:peptidoglycan-associated lipoprotein